MDKDPQTTPSNKLPIPTENLPKKHRGGHHNRIINVKKALALRLKCVSYEDIACVFDVSYQAVVETLEPFGAIVKNPELLQAYKEHRQDFHLFNQLACDTIFPSKLKDKKTTAGNTAYAKRQYYEIERIESDKSIGNYSHFTHLVESATEGREPSKSSSKATDGSDKQLPLPTVTND